MSGEATTFTDYVDVMKLDYSVPKGHSQLQQFSADWGYGNHLGTLYTSQKKPALHKQLSFLTNGWEDYFKMGRVPLKQMKESEYSTGGEASEENVKAEPKEEGTDVEKELANAHPRPSFAPHYRAESPAKRVQRGLDKELEAQGGWGDDGELDEALEQAGVSRGGGGGGGGGADSHLTEPRPSSRQEKAFEEEAIIFQSPKKKGQDFPPLEKLPKFLQGTAPQIIGSTIIRFGKFEGLRVPVIRAGEQLYRMEGNSNDKIEFRVVKSFDKKHPDLSSLGGENVGVLSDDDTTPVFKTSKGIYYYVDDGIPRNLRQSQITFRP